MQHSCALRWSAKSPTETCWRKTLAPRGARWHAVTMSEFTARRVTELGPQEGLIHVATPAGAATTIIDLETVLQNANTRQEFITVTCSQPINYKFSDNASATINPAATSGATRCFQRPADVPFREVPTGRYFVMTTTDACTVRMYVSSKVLG